MSEISSDLGFFEQVIRDITGDAGYIAQEAHQLERDVGMESIDLLELYFTSEPLIPLETFFARLGALPGSQMSEDEWRNAKERYGISDKERGQHLGMIVKAVPYDPNHRPDRERLSPEMFRELKSYTTPPFTVARLLEIASVQRDLAADALQDEAKNA